MGVYDLSFKALFDDRPEELLRLALGEELALEEVVPEPTETQIVERKQDRLARVRVREEEFLVLLEFKAGYEADIDRQMFTYSSRAQILHGFMPVLPIVYYLKEEGYPAQAKTKYETKVLGRSVCRMDFEEVKLFEGSVEEALRSGNGSRLALLPFLKGAGPAGVVQASRAIEELVRPREEKRNLQAVLTVLTQQVFPELDLDSMIPREALMGSKLFQDILEEGIQMGIEQGIERGELQVLRRLARKRFRTEPGWLAAWASGKSAEALEKAAEALLDAKSAKDWKEKLAKLG